MKDAQSLKISLGPVAKAPAKKRKSNNFSNGGKW